VDAQPDTVAWLERYYALLDSGQVQAVIAEFLAPDCTFRVANEEPVGFREAGRALGPFVKGLRHRLLSVLEADGTIAAELEITYIRHDGSSVTLPGALFATVRDGRFIEQRAYVDQGRLTTNRTANERTD
jgi:ketosteroid isomerase-like protein